MTEAAEDALSLWADEVNKGLKHLVELQKQVMALETAPSSLLSLIQNAQARMTSLEQRLEERHARLVALEKDSASGCAECERIEGLEHRMRVVEHDLGVRGNRLTELENEVETHDAWIGDRSSGITRQVGILEDAMKAHTERLCALEKGEDVSARFDSVEDELRAGVRVYVKRLADCELATMGHSKRIADLEVSFPSAVPSSAATKAIRDAEQEVIAEARHIANAWGPAAHGLIRVLLLKLDALKKPERP